MAAPLIIPDFIKQARLAALGAGIACGPDDPATVALMLAAVAYNRIPQVNKAEMLRQECAQAQEKLLTASSNLQAERLKNERLQADIAELRAAGMPPEALATYRAASRQQSALMKENHRLRQEVQSLKQPKPRTLWRAA